MSVPVASLGGTDNPRRILVFRIGQLGDSMAATAERLSSGVIEDSLADVQLVIVVLLLVLMIWTAVPAVGALAFGLWLRRELRANSV